MKAVAVFLLFFCSLNSYGKTFNIVTLNWRPYIAQNMYQQGPVAEIIQAAFNSQGHSIKLHFFPWARALSNSRLDRYDGLIPEYFSADRQAEYTMIDIKATSPVVFCKQSYLKMDPPYTGKLEQVKKYRVGVVRDYINTKEFDEAPYLLKDEATDDLNNLVKLYKKRVDLIVIDKHVAKEVIAENPDKLGKMKIECLSPALNINKLYLAVYKRNPRHDEIVSIARKGIEEIKNVIPEILKRHQLQ